MEKVGDDLPWDRPKPDPNDGDLFAQDRLTLARIAAEPIFRDGGQPAPRAVDSGEPKPEA